MVRWPKSWSKIIGSSFPICVEWAVLTSGERLREGCPGPRYRSNPRSAERCRRSTLSPTISAAAEVKVPDLWVRQLCVPRSKPGKRGVHHTRRHYAELYARTGAIHDAFSRQFAAFNQDGED